MASLPIREDVVTDPHQPAVATLPTRLLGLLLT